jgi:type III pantothenate kinase
MIDALVTEIRRELDVDAPAIATGGLAALVGPRCRTVNRVEPELTLTGLLSVDRFLRS